MAGLATGTPPENDTPRRAQLWAGRAKALVLGRAEDAGWGLGFELVVLLSSLVTFGALTTKLGPVDYGYYAGVQGLTSLLATFGGAWVVMVLMQNVVRDGVPLDKATRSATSWTMLATLVALAGAIALAPVLLPHISLWVVLAFVAAEVVGDQLAQLAAGVVYTAVGFAASVRIKMAYAVITSLVLIAQWATNTVTLLSVGIGQLVAALAVGVLAVAWCDRHHHLTIRFGRPWPRDVREGFLYSLVLFCFSLQEDVDKTLLVRYRKTGDAGHYAAAYRIVQVALVPLRAAVAATHKRFLLHDENAVGEHRRRALGMTVPAAAYGFAAVVGMVVLAPIVPHILGARYAGSVIMIRALAAFVFLRSLTMFAHNGLMGLGKTGVRTTILVASSLVNVSVNLALIPVWSWRGAVVATISSEIVFCAATWTALIVLQRRHDEGVRARLNGDG